MSEAHEQKAAATMLFLDDPPDSEDRSGLERAARLLRNAAGHHDPYNTGAGVAPLADHLREGARYIEAEIARLDRRERRAVKGSNRERG